MNRYSHRPLPPYPLSPRSLADRVLLLLCIPSLLFLLRFVCGLLGVAFVSGAREDPASLAAVLGVLTLWVLVYGCCVLIPFVGALLRRHRLPDWLCWL